MAESSFRLSRPLEERISICARLRKTHNGKIPLLLDKAEHSDVPDIDNNKKLLSADVTIGQVEDMLRTLTNLATEKSIFVFVKNTLCPSAASISAIYEEHKDEDGFLYMTYSTGDLLFTMKTALGIADSILREGGPVYIEDLSKTWLPYLSTLQKLVSVSESHMSLKESFEGLLKDRMDVFCTLITCFAKEGDRVWVMKLRAFTNFEVRSHFTKLLFPSGLGEFEKFKILVDRSSFFEESVKQVSEAEPLLFRGGISVSFKNEVAFGEGVFREWILLVCNELFDSSRNLFKQSHDDLRRFSLNPLSYEDENHLELFRFAGRIIALSLKHEVQVGILFDPLFFLQLRGQSISLEDIISSDKTLHKSLKDILEMDGDKFDECEGLGLCFEVDGKSVAVTSKDRERYIALEMKYNFETQIEDQLKNFSRGFEEMLLGAKISTFFSILDLGDLDSLLRGSDEDSICVNEWKAHTVYKNFEESDDVIIWFWKVVNGLNQEQRRNLLFFWTANRYLPRGGFKGLPMELSICGVYGRQPNHLTSHTCLFDLHLPVYKSYKETKSGVAYVTLDDHSYGFGLF